MVIAEDDDPTNRNHTLSELYIEEQHKLSHFKIVKKNILSEPSVNINVTNSVFSDIVKIF